MFSARVIRTILLLAASLGCGGSSSTGSSAPTAPTPPASAAPPTVRLAQTGATPQEVSVAVGLRVTFVNDDTKPHDIFGGPDPEHPDCPEIDAVGFLVPGQRRQTAPFTVARTCEYHDHSFHSPLFTGRIVIR